MGTDPPRTGGFMDVLKLLDLWILMTLCIKVSRFQKKLFCKLNDVLMADLSRILVFVLTDVPLDVMEEALGGGEREIVAATTAPPGVSAQTTSPSLTKPLILSQFESTSMPEERFFKNRKPWEKSSGDIQEISASSTNSTLTSGYRSDVEFLDDAYYDYNSTPDPEEQRVQTGGSAQIRSKNQPAYRHVTDTYETKAAKPAARSPSAMRRNVDAHAPSSGETGNAKVASDAGEVWWVREGHQDDVDDVAVETRVVDSSIAPPALMDTNAPKVQRRSKGAVWLEIFNFYFVKIVTTSVKACIVTHPSPNSYYCNVTTVKK